MKKSLKKKPHFVSNCRKKSSNHGGATMEYILITTFAAVVGVATLSYIGSSIKDKLSLMNQKLGTETEETLEFDIFNR